MKIIVSHDVDHLYSSDHWRDLFFPKFIVRSLIGFVKGEIGGRTFINRIWSLFDKRMNRIPELCEFDKENGVRATYFFGMANALGMAYKQKDSLPWIRYVKEHGFDAGVHGCNYQHLGSICKEHNDFADLTGYELFGIRNHYVRYDKETFIKMNQAGYLFDTTEFNKETLTYKEPYKVGDMWEFPLAIMDGYVIMKDLQTTKENIESFISSIPSDSQYLTLLFHDVFYNGKCYPREKAFYEWIIKFLKGKGFVFISYVDAIKELENERDN